MKVHAFVRVNAGRLHDYISDQSKYKKGIKLKCFLTIASYFYLANYKVKNTMEIIDAGEFYRVQESDINIQETETREYRYRLVNSRYFKKIQKTFT